MNTETNTIYAIEVYHLKRGDIFIHGYFKNEIDAQMAIADLIEKDYDEQWDYRIIPLKVD